MAVRQMRSYRADAVAFRSSPPILDSAIKSRRGACPAPSPPQGRADTRRRATGGARPLIPRGSLVEVDVHVVDQGVLRSIV